MQQRWIRHQFLRDEEQTQVSREREWRAVNTQARAHWYRTVRNIRRTDTSVVEHLCAVQGPRLFPNTQEKIRGKEGKKGREGGERGERERQEGGKKTIQWTKILNKHYNMLFRKPTGFSIFWKSLVHICKGKTYERAFRISFSRVQGLCLSGCILPVALGPTRY